MKVYGFALLLLGLCLPVMATEGIFVPWDEIKVWHRQQIEAELKKELLPKTKEIFKYTIAEANYTLQLNKRHGQGTVQYSGAMLQGKAEPFLLLGPEVIVTQIHHESGGTVLMAQDIKGTAFLCDQDAEQFEVHIEFSVPARTADDAKELLMTIPTALTNTLHLHHDEAIQPLHIPGIPDEEGMRHFASGTQLKVRYADSGGLQTNTIVAVDSLSQLRIQKKQLFIRTWFKPQRELPKTITLIAPANSRILASSINPAWIQPQEDDSYTIQTEHMDGPFEIEFAVDALLEAEESTLRLPAILENAGSEGRFFVQEPENGQLSIQADHLSSHLPMARLDPVLRQYLTPNALEADVQGGLFHMQVPIQEALHLSFKRFKSIAEPTTVLDQVHFYTAFEENGNVLSVLHLQVPPEIGPRLVMSAIPGASIWSLTVNGTQKKVFADDEERWVSPWRMASAPWWNWPFSPRPKRWASMGVWIPNCPNWDCPLKNYW